MELDKMSRRQFLGGAAVLGVAAALPSALTATPAFATPAITFPLASDTGGWVPLDPKACARQALEIYRGKWAGHSACCEATYWPIVGVFAARFPTTWGLVPAGMFNYGGGGVNAYGSICGCPNGASALLSQIGATTAVKMNFMSWYEKTALPTNAAYTDFASGTWTPGGSATGGWGLTFGTPSNQLATPLDNIPKSAAGEILCHVSLTKWRAAADKWTGVLQQDAQSERCAKLCYDAVFYLATLINSWKAGATIDGSVSPAASATGCKNPSCHGSSPLAECDAVTAQGSMNCAPCHSLSSGPR
jgi:hypothetical protein